MYIMYHFLKKAIKVHPKHKQNKQFKNLEALLVPCNRIQFFLKLYILFFFFTRRSYIWFDSVVTDLENRIFDYLRP